MKIAKEYVENYIAKRGRQSPALAHSESSVQGLEERIEILCSFFRREYFRALEKLELKHLYSDDDATFYYIDIITQRIVMIDSDFRDYEITDYRVSNEFINLLDDIEITDICFLEDENKREYMQIDYNYDDISCREVIYHE